MIRFLNLIFFAIMIVMNYLANALPLNNRTTGEISDSIPNLFAPAGITFSIWGIIYLLLLIYCVVQFSEANGAISLRIGWVFGISCLLNGLWIVFWHYGRLPLSLLVMFGILSALIYINIQISSLPSGLIKAAFGIYLGWICIAAIANLTALLVHYNWNGWNIAEETWTIVMISAGAIITSLTIYYINNPFTGLAVVWAFTGIILKRHLDYRSIVITAAVGIIMVTIITLYVFLRRKMIIQG